MHNAAMQVVLSLLTEGRARPLAVASGYIVHGRGNSRSYLLRGLAIVGRELVQLS